jgi:hypothetical protein
MRKNEDTINPTIHFKELPRRLQHALQIEVEWHSVLVYEIEKGMYGFYILDEYMPGGSDFTGLIDSEYSYGNDGFIQETIQNVIDTKFKGIRCRYFPKGCLSLSSLQISIAITCPIKLGYGFSIEVHSNDYGFLEEEKAKIAPAYAHVLDVDELEIGLLNITGPCPKRVADINEFRPPHLFGDSDPINITPLMKYRRNLVKWANSLRQDENYNYWFWSRYIWKMAHENKR